MTNCLIQSCKGFNNCLDHCPCDCHLKNQGDKIWDNAIAETYTSKIRTIFIQLTDALGYTDSIDQRNAFNQAFKELLELYKNR